MPHKTATNDGGFAVSDADILEYLREKGRQFKDRDLTKVERANVLALGRNEVFFEQLENVAKKVFKNKVVPRGFATKKQSGNYSRTLNLMLSDLHFGSALDGRDSASKYGPVEEARRLAAIVKQVIEYKQEYRNNTKLVVHLLGDIIENQLHDPRVGEPLAAQACAAIYLLSQAIAILASKFKKVEVHCATGNHGRFKSRHPERAIHQKWDSLETVIYFSLKQACNNLKNVTVSIPKEPYYVVGEHGVGVFATHGDTVLRPGNPGKSINVENIEHQIAKIKTAIDTPQSPLKLFLCGHVHVPTMVYLANGEVFMTNGALVPSNAYTISLGELHTVCGQTIWESVKGHVVGDYRFVTVNEETDKDESLDKIIKPFLEL